jgi:Secretion system C-terminal sorting domain/FG-GAP-like repeat
MKTKLFFTSIICLAISITELAAQGEYKPATGVSVSVAGNTIRNPWVGGFNAPIFSAIDLNGDGIKDLFVFDREGDRMSTYINNGTANQVDYVYAPQYKKKFPKDMHGFVMLKDFNCDGKEDIFTYSYAGGMMVYRNDFSIQSGLKFNLTYPLVNSKYGTITANLYVASVNLPALVDVDSDGDLDVLTFPVSGNFVEYHQNQGMELYGRCDTLVYQLIPSCWGNFGLSGTSNTGILGVSCRIANPQPPPAIDKLVQVQHSGSCMLAVDLDGDIDYELLNGDILGNNILALYNGGTPAVANITSQDDSFPSYNTPVNLVTFPAPYYFDVNNDGNNDFVVAPCISGPSENFNNIWYYRNTTNNSSNVFNLQKKRFLVDEMIEVGTGANVVFHDVNADGLKDMIIGNYGYYSDVLPFKSSLSYYRNSGTATTPSYEFVTDDFGGFLTLGLTGLAPAFGDVDNDGDADLMLGNTDGNIVYYTNTAGAGNIPVYSLTQTSLLNNVGGIIDVGQFSAPQLVDVNKDGKIDLLIGEKSGNINYYENTGSAGSPEFTLSNANFGGVLVNNSLSLYGYSYPCLYDSAGVSQLLVGAVNGYIYQYNNIDNNVNGNFTLVDSMYYGILEPQRITVSVADINNDGKNEILTGNNAGGVTLYKWDSSTGIASPDDDSNNFLIYPNPATNELFVKFNSPLNVEREIAIFDITGRLVDTKSTFLNVVHFEFNNLSSGVYHCRVIEGNHVSSTKFIVQ